MKILKTILLLLIFTFSFINVSANEEKSLSIIDIDATNSNFLKIFFDKNIETNSQEVSSDIKVFRDLDNKNIELDLENDKLVHLTFNEDIQANTSYSLLSVYGAEGTIDFNIESLDTPIEITGSSSEGIEKLLISDSKTVDVYFNKSIESESVDVKLLREYKTDTLKVNSDDSKQFDIYLKDGLVGNSKYIIMIFSIILDESNNYSVSNSIYDFVTESISSEKAEIPSEESSEHSLDETSEVALNSAETPDTGAETWILVFFTLLFSSFIYFRKKFVKN